MEDWEKAELEGEDDDILTRRAARRAPAPAEPSQPWGSRWIIVIALLVGVAIGAWFAGRASVTPSDSSTAATASASAGEG
jgi:hypothetical protein